MTGQPFREVVGPLPGERDFDPHEGDLDAQVAWRNFGGLTLGEAYEKFQENPFVYQEDFMWMGGKAFAYYFPVLERYVLVTPVWSEAAGSEWCQVYGLGAAIQVQFAENCLPEVRLLVPRVLPLIAQVKESFDAFVASGHPYYSDPEMQQHVIREWNELEAHLQQFGET
ncbi:hypothetical protein Pan153_15420 [Gimesia panareensis]|uniref:Uncharacterized protein n=1 Tax=Gimesia panareensis TaxID=2527978 RepID=A0A518FKN1_9PLAN|nr:hypothetical protein [Gimesia panareensis]QDV16908.1 hypothetical protein Pan153_15420 [Gimesia panareensis]